MSGPVEALLFDVFGTVVDWRSGVAREAEIIAQRLGLPPLDWAGFADRWRARYQPAMEEVRSGRRPFVSLDVLHRENLDALLRDSGIEPGRDIQEADLDDLNRAWHRLDPWEDSVEGVTRLKTRFIVAPHSNGNLALLTKMAKRAGLPWDAILGAEVVGHYKPEPASYRGACEMLGLPPERCMLVAAHNSDLIAARDACGMQTAFISRPYEYGPEGRDASPTAEFDYVAESLTHLAAQLGC
jgi:2-haloacid dehalogenase